MAGDHSAISAADFADIGFRSDARFELVNGAIASRTARTVAQSRVAAAIARSMHARLQGVGHLALPASSGVRIDDNNVRFPDVTVVAGGPDPEFMTRAQRDDAVVIVEVLSPGISAREQLHAIEQYRSLPSVDTIVFVDPVNELTRTIQRLGPTSWRDDMFAQPHDVELPALGLTIPHAEMFARD